MLAGVGVNKCGQEIMFNPKLMVLVLLASSLWRAVVS